MGLYKLKDALDHLFHRVNSFFRFYGNKFLNRRILKYLSLVVGFIFFIFILFIIFVYIGFFGPLPGKQELKNIRNPSASEVYSSDSILMGRYYIQNRLDLSGN